VPALLVVFFCCVRTGVKLVSRYSTVAVKMGKGRVEQDCCFIGFDIEKFYGGRTVRL
jgi:hypothetical protein